MNITQMLGFIEAPTTPGSLGGMKVLIGAFTVGNLNTTVGSTLPTGWAPNDNFIMFVYCDGGEPATPTGWTRSTAPYYNYGGIYWRLAVGGDTAPSFINSGFNCAFTICFAVRGARTLSSPVDNSSTAGAGLAELQFAPSIITTKNNALLLFFEGAFGYSPDNFSPYANTNYSNISGPSGLFLVGDSTYSSDSTTAASISVFWGNAATAGATGTQSGNLGGGDESSSGDVILIAISPH